MTTTVETPVGSRLLNKLNTYPLVHDSYDQAFSYYNWVKSSTPLVSGPLNLAEFGVRKVAYTTQPILTRLDKPLSKVEDAAMSGLDQMETRYPAVLKPTQEIIQDTRSYIEPLVKPVTDTYNNARELLSPQTIVNQAKYVGMESLIRFGHTGVGKTSLNILEQVLDQADHYADQYLPENNENEKKENNDEEIEKKDDVKNNGEIVLRKSMRLTSKMQRRIHARAMKALSEVKLRSEESIKKLQFTVNLMEYARTGVDGLKTKWVQVKDEVVDTMDEMNNAKEDAKKSRSKLVNLSRQYANTARLSVLASSKVLYKHLSVEHQALLNKAVNYTEEMYSTLLKIKTIDDLSQSFFTQSREALKFIQESLETSFQYISQIKMLNFLKRSPTTDSKTKDQQKQDKNDKTKQETNTKTKNPEPKDKNKKDEPESKTKTENQQKEDKSRNVEEKTDSKPEDQPKEDTNTKVEQKEEKTEDSHEENVEDEPSTEDAEKSHVEEENPKEQ